MYIIGTIETKEQRKEVKIWQQEKKIYGFY